jgi:hypothetical protein
MISPSAPLPQALPQVSCVGGGSIYRNEYVCLTSTGPAFCTLDGRAPQPAPASTIGLTSDGQAEFATVACGSTEQLQFEPITGLVAAPRSHVELCQARPGSHRVRVDRQSDSVDVQIDCPRGCRAAITLDFAHTHHAIATFSAVNAGIGVTDVSGQLTRLARRILGKRPTLGLLTVESIDTGAWVRPGPRIQRNVNVF